MSRKLVIMVLATSAAACALASQASVGTVPDATDQQAIARLFDLTAQALGSGNSASWIASFAEGAVFQPPNAPAVKGRDAIRAWAQSLPPPDRVEFSGLQLTGTGDVVYGTSAYALKYQDSSIVHGRQLAVLNRVAGKWIITALSFSPDERAVTTGQLAGSGGTQKAEKTPSAEIAITVAGVFLGWILVQSITYCLIRKRLSTFLLAQVNTRLETAVANVAWFRTLTGRMVENTVPDDAPRYLIDLAEDITESRELVLRYLWTSEVHRLTKFVADYRKAEFLMQGITETVSALSRRQTTTAVSAVPQPKPISALEAGDIRYRFTLVEQVVSQWPNAITDLSQLPS